MQITFLKKNAGTSNQTFNLDEGSTITENYNETLDTAHIRISHRTSSINIEPFDKVILHDENNRLSDRYMLVDTFTESMEGLDPVIYSYEIDLFSETKELENIILPNLSITKNSTLTTIWAYLRKYNDLYGPKIRVNNQFVNKYTFNNVHNIMSTKFNVDCPEMQWNAPTFREVLTNLMMVVDCIPILRNNKIEFIDLTKTKDEVDVSKTNYIIRTQSSEDYVSELKMNMVNVMQTSVAGTKQSVRRVEYQTFKPSSGYILNTENAIIKTQYPILKLNSVKICFQNIVVVEPNVANPRYDTVWYEGDITGSVLEYTAWQTLPVMGDLLASIVNAFFQSIYDGEITPSNFADHFIEGTPKQLFLYYTRYSNVISGFNQRFGFEFLGINFDVSTLEIMKFISALAYSSTDGTYHRNPSDFVSLAASNTNENCWFTTFFIIDYETTADAVFKSSKDIAPTHTREVVDNQTYSFVDSYNQGFMEYQKANRLGNKQLHINARFEDNYNNLIKIGDYYEESVVYQTVYQIYDNHIEVNALATKNYILRNYFTGVKARIRSWKIADASESFDRHELVKYYLEFSESPKNEYAVAPVDKFCYYFLTPLHSAIIQPIDHAFAYTIDENDVKYPEDAPGSYSIKYFTLDCIGRIMGNSLVFTFGFFDNFSAGQSVSLNDSTMYYAGSAVTINLLYYVFQLKGTAQYQGIPFHENRYVDGEGTFLELNYILTDDMNMPFTPQRYTMTASTLGKIGDPNDKTWMERVCDLPVTYTDTFLPYKRFEKTMDVFKDNKETLKVSTQFEICSDTHDIVFTKKFLELQQCIRTFAEVEIEDDWHSELDIPNDIFIKHGGSNSLTATVKPPYLSDKDHPGVDTGYFELKLENLYGETLTNLSITNTVEGYTNSVTYENVYQEWDETTHQYRNYLKISGIIYTTNPNRNQSATVTYTISTSETPYWTASVIGTPDPRFIGQTIQNIQIEEGPTLGANDVLEVTFNKNTGSFSVYYKRYTEPEGDYSVTFSFEWVLSDGYNVSNTTKVYKLDVRDWEWDYKHPEDGFALAAVDNNLYLSMDEGTKSCHLTINNGTTGYYYFITDSHDNLILATNELLSFYLNMLLSRDYAIYDENGNIINSI